MFSRIFTIFSVRITAFGEIRLQTRHELKLELSGPSGAGAPCLVWYVRPVNIRTSSGSWSSAHISR